MNNLLFYLFLLLLSTARHLGALGTWLNAEDEDAPAAAHLLKMIIWYMTSIFSQPIFRLILLAGSVLFGHDRLRDIQFQQHHAGPEQVAAWQVILNPEAELPRYVRITDVVPLETMVEEKKSRYFIPTGKATIYAADIRQALPADTAMRANVLAHLTDPDHENRPRLTLFVHQKADSAPEPEPGVRREVIGLVDDNTYLDADSDTIFEEDGYSVSPPIRYIKEGVLPDALWQLYIQFGLLVLLAIAQPLAYIRERRQGREVDQAN